MAVTYGFYNSLNKDRVYNAEQMSSIFNGIITDGVFASIGGSLMPIAGTGMQVVVKTGKCWFNSTWTLNDALLPLDIPAADVSLTRIDAVVVEINSAISTRANTIKVVKGTPSANPAKPALANTETLHQYALGYVTIGSGVTSITADKIEVNVGKSTCPFITSVLQQTDITALFDQWDAEFNTWFANVQAQLSGNVAANLQRQIDALDVKIDSNWDKTLKSYTKKLLGIPESSSPDDAFLALYVGVGKYAYRVKVQFVDGTPVTGAIISGIDAIPGKNLTTGDDGIVLGISNNTIVDIDCASPYIDQKAPDTQHVTSTGTVTDVTMTLTNETGLITIASSRTINKSQISKFVKSIDLAGVNGGQDGGSSNYSAGGHSNNNIGGAGGSSGYTKNVSIPNTNLTFVIGSHVDWKDDSENETYVQIDGVKHDFSVKYSGRPKVQTHTDGLGVWSGSAGVTGYHIFDDPALNVIGSSGGSGGIINDFGGHINPGKLANGGSGGQNAGSGGGASYSSSDKYGYSEPTAASFYGCGGGGGSEWRSPRNERGCHGADGKAGAAFIRFNF
jgi:hypothetical protein